MAIMILLLNILRQVSIPLFTSRTDSLHVYNHGLPFTLVDIVYCLIRNHSSSPRGVDVYDAQPELLILRD